MHVSIRLANILIHLGTGACASEIHGIPCLFAYNCSSLRGSLPLTDFNEFVDLAVTTGGIQITVRSRCVHGIAPWE